MFDCMPLSEMADLAPSAQVLSGHVGTCLLERAIRTDHAGRVAVVSSFGAESAVLLALVADIDPSTPVFFVDTRQHFPETLAYRDELVRVLGLTDVRSIGPTDGEVAE